MLEVKKLFNEDPLSLMIHIIKFNTLDVLDSYPEIRTFFDTMDVSEEIRTRYDNLKKYKDIIYTTYSLSFHFNDYPYDYSSTYYFALDNGHFPEKYHHKDYFDSFSKDPIFNIIKFCNEKHYGMADGVEKQYELLYIYIQEHKFDDWCDTIGDSPDQIYKLVDNKWILEELHKGTPIDF